MGLRENRIAAEAYIVRVKAVVFHIRSALAELDAVIGGGSILGERAVGWDMGQAVGRGAVVIGNSMADNLRGELTRAEHLLNRAEDYLRALHS